MVENRLRTQDLAFYASAGAGVGAVTALVARRWRVALACGLTAIGATVAGKLASRKSPAAMPYSLRWTLPLSRPFFPMPTLCNLLALEPGHHVLEVGPGLGHQAIPVADIVGDGGGIEVIDVQRSMIEATRARSAALGRTNLHGQIADARRLPFRDDSFDGAFLVTVLGEVPDRDEAWSELRRILKPGGRLVVGEMVLDPDSISRSTLRGEGAAAGFEHITTSGLGLSYYTAFARPEPPGITA